MDKRKVFWLDAQNHLASADAAMASLVVKYGPCTLLPRYDYFLQLCRSIISQQLANKAAAAIFARFTAHFGSSPTPAVIAGVPEDILRQLGLSARKAAYIKDLADKALTGGICFNDFCNLPDEQIISQLVSIKGIGVWTAQMFLIFALNRPDVLPTDDLGIRKAMMQRYGLADWPTQAAMETIARPWRPWRSIASWYLWRSLDN